MKSSNSSELEFSGLAALSIYESLLLALKDARVLSCQDARGILEDAAEAHRKAIGTAEELEVHRVVATIIDRILAGRHLAQK